MALEVDDTYILLMLEQLQASSADGLNGPAQYMLAQELADLDKPFEALTLGELQAALERTDVRYRRMSICYGAPGCGKTSALLGEA